MPVFNNDYGTFLGAMMERTPERIMAGQTSGQQFGWMQNVAGQAKKYMDSKNPNERMMGISWLAALIGRDLPSFMEIGPGGFGQVGGGGDSFPSGWATFSGDGSKGNQYNSSGSSGNWGGKYGPPKIKG